MLRYVRRHVALTVHCSVLFCIFLSVKDVVYQNGLDISLDSYSEYQQPVAVSPHASGYNTFDVKLEVRSVRCELSAQVRATVDRAGCGRTCRGRRPGKHVNDRRHCRPHNFKLTA